jgi:hypothetical protein
MVIKGKPSYNLLVGREWLHGVGAVPSSMHQRLIIWREDGIAENINADQGYFLADVNHVGPTDFDRKLANIAPCLPAEEGYQNLSESFVSLRLHETHGFVWDVEPLGDIYADPAPTGWGQPTSDDV